MEVTLLQNPWGSSGAWPPLQLPHFPALFVPHLITVERASRHIWFLWISKQLQRKKECLGRRRCCSCRRGQLCSSRLPGTCRCQGCPQQTPLRDWDGTEMHISPQHPCAAGTHLHTLSGHNLQELGVKPGGGRGVRRQRGRQLNPWQLCAGRSKLCWDGTKQVVVAVVMKAARPQCTGAALHGAMHRIPAQQQWAEGATLGAAGLGRVGSQLWLHVFCLGEERPCERAALADRRLRAGPNQKQRAPGCCC